MTAGADGRLGVRLPDAGFAAAWAVVKALPRPIAAAGFRLGADLAIRRGAPGALRLRANLSRVLGADADPAALDALVRRAMRSYARYWMETFRLPVMVQAAAEGTAAGTIGAENLDAALAAGRGVVMTLPHSGNWDVAGVWLISHTGRPFTTVAERLRPESLFRRFVAFRESLGMEIVPLTGGARAPADVLAERLRAGGVVCLLGDRDLTRNGVDVTFFGERARMPAGPALLAATTGAPLLPVGIWFDGDRWGQDIHPPVEIPTGGRLRDRVAVATQAVADSFAADIAKHPEDWHMLQRLWLADLPAGAADRRAAARAAQPAPGEPPARPVPPGQPEQPTQVELSAQPEPVRPEPVSAPAEPASVPPQVQPRPRAAPPAGGG